VINMTLPDSAETYIHRVGKLERDGEEEREDRRGKKGEEGEERRGRKCVGWTVT
jgi:superfamily II DNA/RNA helicase